MVSCFTALCSLSMILSTIMFEIYGSSSPQDTHASAPPREERNSKNFSFIKISSAIQKWWVELPDVIRLNVKNLPNLSPPLHILTLNLLYHTTLILLHRPFIIGKTKFDSHGVMRSYQSMYPRKRPRYILSRFESAFPQIEEVLSSDTRQGDHAEMTQDAPPSFSLLHIGQKADLTIFSLHYCCCCNSRLVGSPYGNFRL
jgi:hypothetical protein